MKMIMKNKRGQGPMYRVVIIVGLILFLIVAIFVAVKFITKSSGGALGVLG